MWEVIHCLRLVVTHTIVFHDRSVVSLAALAEPITWKSTTGTQYTVEIGCMETALQHARQVPLNVETDGLVFLYLYSKVHSS